MRVRIYGLDCSGLSDHSISPRISSWLAWLFDGDLNSVHSVIRAPGTFVCFLGLCLWYWRDVFRARIDWVSLPILVTASDLTSSNPILMPVVGLLTISVDCGIAQSLYFILYPQGLGHIYCHSIVSVLVGFGRLVRDGNFGVWVGSYQVRLLAEPGLSLTQLALSISNNSV